MDCLYCCHLAKICPSDLAIFLSSLQILLGAFLPMLNAAEHLFHLLIPPVLWPLRSPCTTVLVVSRFFLVLDLKLISLLKLSLLQSPLLISQQEQSGTPYQASC